MLGKSYIGKIDNNGTTARETSGTLGVGNSWKAIS